MNKETYEALKHLVKFYRDNDMLLQEGDLEMYGIEKEKDIKQAEKWIDEVAKEYEYNCESCGATRQSFKGLCDSCKGICRHCGKQHTNALCDGGTK